MSLARPPRAVRNFNPGNLENSISWLGLASPEQMNREQKCEQRFAVFCDARFGFRALGLDLFTSWRRGRKSVRQLITRFAPRSENPTDNYISRVCELTGFGPDVPLDLTDVGQLTALCKAIARVESGGWFFTDDDLNAGVRMALDGTPKAAVA